jgi:PAS domain S-box-containing protein
MAPGGQVFSKLRSRLLAAFLSVAAVTLVGALVGLAGLGGLARRLEGITGGVWPTADMCMEFWIGSLSKERAARRYAEGDLAGGREELAWARAFVANSLVRLEAARRLPAGALDEMRRLDAECEAAVEALLAAADHERGLAAPAPGGPAGGAASAALGTARAGREEAGRRLDLALRRIEALITPMEHGTDSAMDVAAAEGLAVASRTRWLLLLVAAAGVAAALVIGFAMTEHISRPLRRLSEMTGRIAEGKLRETAGIRRGDEIGELASRFDRMAADLAASRDEILASQARYRTLFEYARDGMVVADGSGAVIETNEVFARLLGLPRDGIRRRPLADFLPAEARADFPRRLARMVGPGSPLEEVDLVRADGTNVPAEAGAVWLPDGRTVVSLRDLSQRRRMEQALVQAEKLSAVGQLAAGVAHELRNPLFVISNVLYDLGESLGPQHPEIHEELRMASEENRRAREIIDNLLEFARPAPEAGCVLDPAAAIRQVLRLFQEALSHHRIELTEDLAPARPCHFHPDAFKQVMVNLLSNAMDAMPGGGRLDVAVRNGGARVQVIVEDSGEGIPDDRRKEIFNPFYSTKPPGRGTGLGLWIVHLAVQRYGGQVTVRSEPGRGSAFTLDLCPAEAAPRGA